MYTWPMSPTLFLSHCMKPELVKRHVLGTTVRMVTGKVVKLPTWGLSHSRKLQQE